jgi:hypothetical protein
MGEVMPIVSAIHIIVNGFENFDEAFDQEREGQGKQP